MENRVLNLVSNRLIVKKNETEIELEKLVNNGYPNLSVEENLEKIEMNLSKLNSVLHNIQLWENILSQTAPQNNENPKEGNNK